MYKNLLSLIIILLSLIVVSCSSEDPVSPPDDQPIVLNAKAGLNQDADVIETVTLDGSQSTGPSGFTYSWIYEGDVSENEINFQNKTSVNPTFVPPSPGLYEFTLTISHGDSSDSDETTVLVGGAIELGGTLTEDLELKNVQSDAYLPDYVVTSDLIIENNIILSVVDEDVRVEFQSGTGLHIKSGGRLTNIDSTIIHGYDVELYGDGGWKGILVENGEIFLNDSKIINAGAETFEGQDEPGVITLIGSDTKLLNLRYNEFVNSRSFDILAPGQISGSGNVINNQFSYKHPLKVSVLFMGFFSPSFTNVFPESYDYSILIPSGSAIMDVPAKGMFLFENEGKYYIDGDFWAGAQIFMDGNTTIYMKEGSGILAEKKILARVADGFSIVFDGLEGAQWKGIASVNINLAAEFQNVTIKNAGYGIIEMGSFEAEAQSALYLLSGGILYDSQIINSGGFGYYNSSTEYSTFELTRTLFKNTTLPAIRTNPQSVGKVLRKNHNCTFELDPGVAACLVQGEGSPEANLDWQALGDDNFYLIDANILDGTNFRVAPGSILKFKAGRSLIRTDITNFISMRGTVDEPIILDGEAGTPGSWGGIYLGTRYGLEHITIRNGGEFLLPNATEIANVISATPDEQNQFIDMTNTTILNSAGYGLVVEANTLDFDFENPENENTFTNNASGDIIRKP